MIFLQNLPNIGVDFPADEEIRKWMVNIRNRPLLLAKSWILIDGFIITSFYLLYLYLFVAYYEIVSANVIKIMLLLTQVKACFFVVACEKSFLLDQVS